VTRETAGMMATSTDQLPLTAGELVSEGLCSAACLIASEGACICRCRGSYHGVLADAPIPQAQRLPAWYERYCGWSQLALDELCPVVSRRQAWRMQANFGWRGPPVYASSGRRWTIETDSGLTDEEGGLAWCVVDALVLLGSVQKATGGRGPSFIYGMKSRTETQAIGALLCELFYGNPDGALSCLRALREDLDARGLRDEWRQRCKRMGLDVDQAQEAER
jgi:hypothetical protein